MAANLAIDDKLLHGALEIGGLKAKKDPVDLALKEFMDRRKQLEIFDIFGMMDPTPDYDYKKREISLNVHVDTPIWSYALRSNDNEYRTEPDTLTSLI